MKKNKKSWVIVAGVIVVLAAFFGVKAFVERPQNLGSELEYIGQETSGCYFHWFCSSDPLTVYYFATDLSQGELKSYFRNATHVEHPNLLGGGGGQYNFDLLFFKPHNQSEEIRLKYYDHTQAVLDIYNLRQTGKQHVVSLTIEDFLAAKSSL